MPGMLLGVHCKRADPVSLKDAVVAFVRATYGESAASDSAEDLAGVEALRAQVISHADAPPGIRDVQAKYYRALCAMEARFPVSRTPGHVDLNFVWQDAFRPQRRAEQVNIHFEKAAVLFNMAAAASQQALSADRKTAHGLLDSAKGFQEAAGLFAALRDGPAAKVEPPRPADISPECAGMLEKLMLAQAQECIRDKAAADGKAPATLARLAKHAAVLYDECHRVLSSQPLSDHFDRTWQAHTSVKGLLHHLEADLHNAADLRAKDDIKGVANEIAQLRAAQTTLVAAKREAKSASQELQDNVASRERAIAERLATAEKENASIYLQRVPQAVDLPTVVPAALVKSLPPTGLEPTPESDALFRGVVPEVTTRALSRYTDLVDGLIRAQVERLETALDDVRLRLREWELPEKLQSLEPGNVAALPEGLKADLAKVSERGGVAHLRDLVSQVRDLRNVSRQELDAAEAELNAEAREDDELRGRYSGRWHRPPSAQLTAGMRDRIKGYRGNISAAESADAQLEARMEADVAAFAALDIDAAAAQMPRLQAPMMSVDDMAPAQAVASIRAGLDGLATLSSQRAALEEALRQRKTTDDILPKLLAGPSDPEALFRTELAKYNDLIKGVDENVAKQAQLLDVVKNANAAFTSAYGVEDWRRQCEGAAQGMRSSARAYIGLAENLTEGVHFYSQLQEAVQALRQQVNDHCSARRVEKDQLIEQLHREAAAQASMASMSLQQQHSYGHQPLPPQQHHGAYPQHGQQHLPPPPSNYYPQQQGQQQYPAYPPNAGAAAPPPPPPAAQPPSNNPLGNLFGFGR